MKKKTQFRFPFQHSVTGKRISVNVFEPEEDETEPSSLISKTATTCWNAISRDEVGKAAIELLDKSGCHWVLLLFFVEHYCQYFRTGKKKEHVKFTKDLRKLHKKIAKFASSVRKWESKIDDLNSEIEPELLVDADAHTPDLGPYQALLRVAQVLARPSMMQLKTKKECIVCLYHLAKISTRKPHYAELADVLQARLDAESDQATTNAHTLDANTLRRTVREFQKENAASYRELEKALRTLVEGAPFAGEKFPPADVKGQK